MTEIEWQDVLANLDRLTDEALWEIVGIAARELRERKQAVKSVKDCPECGWVHNCPLNHHGLCNHAENRNL